MLKIDVVTIFPEMFGGVFNSSIIKRGSDKSLFELKVHNLRTWSVDKKHGKIDDTPYGGGPGMVMMIEPIYNAIKELRSDDSHVVITSASGELFSQKKAESFSLLNHIIIICGHYEGIDQRVIDFLANEEISIGKFVLTGGEIPAMAIVDATVRLIPGVLGNNESLNEETFSIEENGSIVGEYPQYTKPSDFNGWRVPDVLISGNHENIRNWRNENVKKF